MHDGSCESATTRLAPALPARYDGVRLLSAGGMGSVWCADDTTLGRRVAIKLLGESFADDEHAVGRFMREARAAARLSGHPHVITIYDVGDCEGRPYIVMEHVAGGSVADAIRLGAYSRNEALRWIEEAAEALDHAHHRGVVHRDVKPANMLLGVDRVLRLADFGIASLGVEPTLSNTGELFGTAAYLAPEQALGQSATAAGDRYALAVAAFELLTGERPYVGRTFTSQARAHIEDPPPRASWRTPELSSATDAVLQRGMAKSAAERWPTAQALADALRAAVVAPPQTEATETVASPEPDPEPQPALATAPAAEPALAAAWEPEPAPAAAWEANPAPAAREPIPPPLALISAKARRPGRYPALAALVLAVLGLGTVLSFSNRGGQGSKAPPKKTAAVAPVTHARPRPRPQSTTLAATTAKADALEQRGHALMDDGAYAQALPVLRQAVASAPPSTLTYAYALFDLGRTLRLSGDPAAAIPVLEKRLQIPDQPTVVSYELTLARQQAAGQSTAAANTTPAPPSSTPTPTPTGPAPKPTGPAGPEKLKATGAEHSGGAGLSVRPGRPADRHGIVQLPHDGRGGPVGGGNGPRQAGQNLAVPGSPDLLMSAAGVDWLPQRCQNPASALDLLKKLPIRRLLV